MSKNGCKGGEKKIINKPIFYASNSDSGPRSEPVTPHHKTELQRKTIKLHHLPKKGATGSQSHKPTLCGPEVCRHLAACSNPTHTSSRNGRVTHTYSMTPLQLFGTVEQQGNARKGLTRHTGNKARYELASINKSTQLDVTDRSV